MTPGVVEATQLISCSDRGSSAASPASPAAGIISSRSVENIRKRHPSAPASIPETVVPAGTRR